MPSPPSPGKRRRARRHGRRSAAGARDPGRPAGAPGRSPGRQDAVLCALGHRRFFYPTSILSRGTANLLAAMARHRVRRLVVETALGIGSSAGRMGLYYTLFTIPVILPWYFTDKARQESVVASSDADWVIVRPGVLTHGERRGDCRHGLAVGSFLWTVRISRADVAAFMLDQLTSNACLRTAPGVCNP